MPTKPSSLTPEQVSAIITDFAAFGNMAEMARRYNLAQRTTIYRIADQHDPDARTRRAAARAKRFDEIRTRLAAGDRALALAAEYGISRQRVYQIRDGL